MKKLASFIMGTCLVFGFALVPALAQNDNIFNQATDNLGQSAPKGLTNEGATTPGDLINGIINTVVGILGLIATGLIIYAGAIWLTAAGDDTKAKKAKDIIKTTIVGIVIVALAYAITAFVFSQLSATS